jgi:NDP-sugar pyrophosphorylase family protein
MNILMPMSGSGKRFRDAGYKMPKPLIDVNGEFMFKAVLKSLNVDGNKIFIILKEHNDLYDIDKMLDGTVVISDKLTEGATCSALLAENLIDNDDELLITNVDQIVDWDSSNFLDFARKYDGCILNTNPKLKWSFAKVNGDIVEKVSEKTLIDQYATVGIYYWRHGKDFVKYAKQMIDKNIRVNGEFYICPVYNEAIDDGLRIGSYMLPIEKVYYIGTPEDLNDYTRRMRQFVK